MGKISNEMLEQFFYWINERHRIYLKKEAGEPWPWTEDPILQKYKFTNVFRELDTGTIWLRENWLNPYAGHEQLFFNICLYRSFNWWQTAEALGFQEFYDHKIAEDRLNRQVEKGHRVFTNAHMLTGTLGQGSKIRQVCALVLEPLFHAQAKYRPIIGKDNLQSSYEKMLQVFGFGPFLSYEVVTDLRHTRYLNEAPDINTWANAGPGAMRGIHRIYNLSAGGNIPKKYFKEAGYVEVMCWLLDISKQRIQDHVPPLELRDIEHSLCEFDKYMRTKLGEGRPRLNYYPDSQTS